MFRVRMGVPDMDNYWKELVQKKESKSISKDDDQLLKRIAKVIKTLMTNPKHPGLQTHEIKPLSTRYGQKVFQSYLDQGQNANRLFWVYGPQKRDITIIAIEPHPNDHKSNAYKSIKLSNLPAVDFKP